MAVQLEALEEDQLKFDDCPCVIVDGLTEIETVGGAGGGGGGGGVDGILTVKVVLLE